MMSTTALDQLADAAQLVSRAASKTSAAISCMSDTMRHINTNATTAQGHLAQIERAIAAGREVPEESVRLLGVRLAAIVSASE